MTPLYILIAVILAQTTYITITLPRKVRRGKKQGVLIDTSALIDGRIVEIARSGFMSDTLVIPRSVVRELQFLADKGDSDKRERARYGLDVIRELQALDGMTVTIYSDDAHVREGVDERLLVLSKRLNYPICTVDYNLNKVARVEGSAVLNVNDLAKSLRMAFLPGEKTTLELVQKGNDHHQGVGYLADGTMVVVEHAGKYIGKAVRVEFIRALQTAAGKMMFARLIPDTDDKKVPHAQSVPSPKPATEQRERKPKPAGRKAPEVTIKTHSTARRRPPKSSDTEDRLLQLVDKQNDPR